MPFYESFLVAIVAVARLGGAAATMHISWTTDVGVFDDFQGGTFGPDGPWQAVAVFAGRDSDDRPDGIPMALWPTGSDTSKIPMVEVGGNYSVDHIDDGKHGHMGIGDNSFAGTLPNITGSGFAYFDSIALEEKMTNTAAWMNGSVIAADEYYSTLLDDRKINASVGILGLGPDRERVSLDRPKDEEDEHPSMLEQLKEDGKIDSGSFSLHVGSVPLGQTGSLVLGGYEQNRLVGQAGVFSLVKNPVMALLDVAIGVETGASPFDSSVPIGVFAGIGDNEPAQFTNREYGNPSGSAPVTADPAVPYIYLPPGTCEAAAEHLPVSLDDALGLYLWDTSDPKFARIVTSPAYLAFTFADRGSNNVTIKVPFSLLNLTLTTPLVDEPTPYFPCKSHDPLTEGWWGLGRAFLQAAFFAVNFDANLTFLAQAPGPDMGGSVIKAMGEDDTPPGGLDEEGFAASWRSTWTVIPDEDDGLSGGAIAGIVVGVVVAVGAVVGAFFFLRRRKKVKGAEEGEKPPGGRLWSSWWKGAEAQGTPVQEMGVPGTIHEVPGEELAHEISGTSPPAELPASPGR